MSTVTVPPYATPLPQRHIDDVLAIQDPEHGPAGETLQHRLLRAEKFYRREGFTVDRVELDGGAWLPIVRMPDALEERVRCLKAARGFSGALSRVLQSDGMLLVPPGFDRA